MQVRRFSGANGVTITVEVGGEPAGQALVLLHGGGESRHVMAPLARALVAAGRYVVTLDLRGHGDSDHSPDADYSLDAFAADVAAVVGELGVAPIFVGRKLGGLVAAVLAADADFSHAPAAVLVDAGAAIVEAPMRAAREVYAAGAGYADLEQALADIGGRRVGPATEAMVRRLLVCGSDGRWHWRHDPALFDPANPQRVDGMTSSARVAEAVARFGRPLLLIRSDRSSLLDPAAAAALAAHDPVMEFADLVEDGAGTVASRVMDFLDRVARLPDDRPVRHGVDPLSLRQAMGAFATGVAVITTCCDDGEPVGLTANSLCSVSLDPPLILFCLDRKVSTLDLFERNPGFVVNILHIGQEEVSNRFARKGEDRFRDLGWERWDNGAPILQDALASLECDRFAVHDGGDHRIFVGRVRNVWLDPARDPLLFYQGKYRQVHVPT